MAVLPGAEFERQRAGRLDALRAIALGQAEQPQAAAVAVLGMAEALQLLGDEAAGVRPDVAAPMDQPLGRPLLVRPMRSRHRLVQSMRSANHILAPLAKGC